MRNRSFTWATLLIAIVVAAVRPGEASAQVEFFVTTSDLPADVKPLEPVIKANLIAAADAWAAFVDSKPCRIRITFRLDPNAASGRGSGKSVVSARLGKETHEGKLVSEQGWASFMRTGKDPNGDEPDLEVVFEPRYFKTIWWDPRPDLRTERVPPGKLDGMSVVMHELGHAIAFNGWINPKTGGLPGNFISTYDRHVRFDGTDFFFTGPEAVKLWGGPVPLAKTNNNYHHVCDTPTGKAAILKPDLMNGVVMEYGKRYYISLLDVAILYDCNIPLRPLKDTRTGKDDGPVSPAVPAKPPQAGGAGKAGR
jgi:hypothetical protein